MFKTVLHLCLCYITCCKYMAIEFQYLKSIFKNGKSTINIWGTITLGVKGFMHFLEKKD